MKKQFRVWNQKEEGWQEVEGERVTFSPAVYKRWKDWKYFIHRTTNPDADYWVVSEESTGGTVTAKAYYSKTAAIEDVERRLLDPRINVERTLELINAYFARFPNHAEAKEGINNVTLEHA